MSEQEPAGVLADTAAILVAYRWRVIGGPLAIAAGFVLFPYVGYLSGVLLLVGALVSASVMAAAWPDSVEAGLLRKLRGGTSTIGGAR